MILEEAIQKALAGEEVWYPVNWFNLGIERERMQKAALAQTEPIIVSVRTDATFQAYLVVRKYDTKESIPYEQMEKEAKDNKWI